MLPRWPIALRRRKYRRACRGKLERAVGDHPRGRDNTGEVVPGRLSNNSSLEKNHDGLVRVLHAVGWKERFPTYHGQHSHNTKALSQLRRQGAFLWRY